MQYIYPRLYSLHDMPDDAGLPNAETGAITMPPPLNLNSQNLVPYGLYLIDDGQTQFVWYVTHRILSHSQVRNIY